MSTTFTNRIPFDYSIQVYIFYIIHSTIEYVRSTGYLVGNINVQLHMLKLEIKDSALQLFGKPKGIAYRVMTAY